MIRDGAMLHQLDLTKDQRDERIRRYAELLEARIAVEKEQVRLNDAPEKGVPPKQVKGAARRIADYHRHGYTLRVNCRFCWRSDRWLVSAAAHLHQLPGTPVRSANIIALYASTAFAALACWFAPNYRDRHNEAE